MRKSMWSKFNPYGDEEARVGRLWAMVALEKMTIGRRNN